jgi:hypothetical protein
MKRRLITVFVTLTAIAAWLVPVAAAVATDGWTRP